MQLSCSVEHTTASAKHFGPLTGYTYIAHVHSTVYSVILSVYSSIVTNMGVVAEMFDFANRVCW